MFCSSECLIRIFGRQLCTLVGGQIKKGDAAGNWPVTSSTKRVDLAFALHRHHWRKTSTTGSSLHKKKMSLLV